ncbi:MAG: GTP pyrophosphokinase family protein [Clostridia bacterium]|nr:GTP pyrophosphokinase family protein [Clostridia bacterium]
MSTRTKEARTGGGTPALPQMVLDTKLMRAQARHIMETLVDYKELMMMYTCAMKEVETKFDILNTEFKVRNRRNPIASIKTRLKTTTSITEKLARHGCSLSVSNIERHIHDVGGVRVICTYIDDIYLIADALLSQDDITLIRRKDYIAAPKPNGYRSLHLLVTVPVYFADQRRDMKVEVQIRTIAMDFWASLEHQMRYKRDIPEMETVSEELRLCAEEIRRTDEKMLAIRQKIEAAEDLPDEDDLLLEKLSRLDISI